MKKVKKERIEEEIKKHLLKSGFPLELEISSLLEEKGWVIFPNHYIFDTDTKKELEIDILAHKSKYSKTLDKKHNICTTYKLIIECKKNEKNPWVFFLRRRIPIDNPGHVVKHSYNIGLNKQFRFKTKTKSSPEEEDSLHYHSDYWKTHQFKSNEKSTNYCLAFRNSNEHKQIYDAVKTVVDVIKNIKLKSDKEYYGGPFYGIYITIYLPIIVFDGEMFEVRLKKGNFTVKKNKLRNISF